MSSLKPIYLALGFVGACSLVNKFDPVNDVPAAGGTSGAGSTAGGAAGTGGTGATTAGSSNGGKGGTGNAGEGGEAGEGNQGTPITTGLIVVGSNVGSGTTAKHSLILLDPATGLQLADVPVPANIFAIAYEAQRNKWFVFTGSTSSAEPTGPLLAGTMTKTGFQIESTSMVPKPTNQNAVAILNQRILYRSGTHTGGKMDDDTLTLLDTSSSTSVTAIAKLTIPYRYSLTSAVGRPSGSSAGGRVFFLHQNFDPTSGNCETADASANQVCSVYYSSLPIAAADKTTLTLPTASITEVGKVDQNGSNAAMAIQPGSSSNTVAIVVPPRQGLGSNAQVFKFNAATGSNAGSLPFSLDTPTKKVTPLISVSISSVSLDPCNDLAFAGEVANTALLYAVPIGTDPGTVNGFDPQSHSGAVGLVTYEPFTKTLIHYINDQVNPTFVGFQIGGTPTAPTTILRGKTGAKPWGVPANIIPSIVVTQNPDDPPCNAN